MSVPTQWSPVFPEAPPLQTGVKAVQWEVHKEGLMWAVPVKGPKPTPASGFALTGRFEARPLAPAPAELQPAIESTLKAHGSEEYRLVARELKNLTGMDGEPTSLWTLSGPPQDARAQSADNGNYGWNELWEPRADGMRLVTPIYHWTCCD